MTGRDVSYALSAVVDPSDPRSYLAAVNTFYGRAQAALVRRVLFRSQDATRAAIAHENDQHPALFRTARRCVWEGMNR